MDMAQNLSGDMLTLYCNNFMVAKKVDPFFYTLSQGVMDMQPRIDRIIERFSSHWKIKRMSCVDRNIIRIAVFEMLFCKDIPPKVSINEAIDVGKKYGNDDSGAFINGILDSIRIAMEKNELENDRENRANHTNQM